MPRRLLIALAASLACAASFSAAAEDLLAVYADARAADPLLAVSRAQSGVQQELAVQARAGLLPQWSASATQTRNQPGSNDFSQVASTLSQPVFDLGRMRQWDAARTLASAQGAAVSAAEQDLCERVVRAYFGVLTAQAALTTAEANEGALSQQVAQAEDRLKAGLSAAVDVEQARTFFALAQGGTEQSRQALADAREALAQITGHAPGELLPLATDIATPPPEPRDATAWVARAEQANPALLAQQLVVKSGDESISAARAGHLPTLNLGVISQRQHGWNATDPGRTDTQIGVTLNIPIFAGGAVQSQVRQAAYQREIAADQAEATRRGIARDVQAQFRAVESGIKLIESGRAAVQAADLAVASMRAGFQLGTRTMTDLLLAIQNQAAAQNAFEQARHGYVLATLLLQGAAGGLDAEALAHVNALLRK